jgi:ribosomal protein L17
MNRILILLALVILIMSCKNDSKTEGASQITSPNAAAQTATPTALNLQEASVVLENAKTTLENTKNLRKQVDALSDAVKKEKPDEIENVRSTLEGMEEKEAMFIEQLSGALALPLPAGAPTTDEMPGVSLENVAIIKEATGSLTRYAEELKAIQEQVNSLAKKQ